MSLGWLSLWIVLLSILNNFGFYSPSSSSSTGLSSSIKYLAVDLYTYFHQLLDEASLIMIMLGPVYKYSRISLGIILLTFFASPVWFYPESLDSPASGPWSSGQSHMWALFHCIGLKLDHFFGYFSNFCVTFTA